MTDQDSGSRVLALKKMSCRDEIGGIGGERGRCELAFALSQTGEIKSQQGDPFGGELLGDVADHPQRFAAGEAMGEERVSLGFVVGNIEEAGQPPPLSVLELNMERLHVAIVPDS